MAELKARLSLDSSEFTSAISSALMSVEKLSFAMGAIVPMLGGIGGLSGIGMLAHQAMEFSTATIKLADATGISTAAIQRMEAATEPLGISVESLTKNTEKLMISAQKAADGDMVLSAAFVRLGIDVKSFLELPADQQLMAYAEAAHSAGTAAESLQAQNAILGKGFRDLTALVNDFAEAKERANKAEIISEADLQQAKKYDELIKSIELHLKVISVETIGNPLKALETSAENSLIFLGKLQAFLGGGPSPDFVSLSQNIPADTSKEGKRTTTDEDAENTPLEHGATLRMAEENTRAQNAASRNQIKVEEEERRKGKTQRQETLRMAEEETRERNDATRNAVRVEEEERARLKRNRDRAERPAEHEETSASRTENRLDHSLEKQSDSLKRIGGTVGEGRGRSSMVAVFDYQQAIANNTAQMVMLMKQTQTGVGQKRPPISSP
jgi:hypothetical protein